MPATRSMEQVLGINGVDLCVECFGNRADPAILLVHGAAASMLWWDERFCERLAAGGRFVVRYDHRDTGRSVSYPPGAPGYTLRDLVDDAVGILDVLDLGEAHLVGTSMGGGICRLVALEHPDRVASLTLISSSPGGPGLPAPWDRYRAWVTGTAEPDWSDRAAVVEYLLGAKRVLASDARPFDEAAAREFLRRDVERTINVESSQKNHFAMDHGDASPALDRLSAPTLVIHGADDPMLPFGHGQALADGIPGARLLRLERTGHELPPEVWDAVVPAILEHTAGQR